jgi:hypothetical protein
VFNATTGKLIKDGGKTLADLTADFVNVGGDTMAGHLALPTGPAANQATPPTLPPPPRSRQRTPPIPTPSTPTPTRTAAWRVAATR